MFCIQLQFKRYQSKRVFGKTNLKALFPVFYWILQACLQIVNPPDNLCTSAGTGKETTAACFVVDAEDTRSVNIPLLPLEVGTTKLTVRMKSFFGEDEVEMDVKVEVRIPFIDSIFVC